MIHAPTVCMCGEYLFEAKCRKALARHFGHESSIRGNTGSSVAENSLTV